MSTTIEGLIAETRRQVEEGRRIAESAAFSQRPTPGKWSAAEHLAHIALTDRPYLKEITRALETARRKGRTADGPFEGGRIGNWFAGLMEPPPKRRMKTPGRLEPPPRLEAATALSDFAACREELIASLESARDVDLDRAKMGSPFLKLLRMPVSSAYEVLLAHGRRHLWIAREALDSLGS